MSLEQQLTNSLSSSSFCQFKIHRISKDRPKHLCIRHTDQVYGIATAIVLVSILESLEHTLCFNSSYHLDKWTNSKAKSKSKRGMYQCVSYSPKRTGRTTYCKQPFVSSNYHTPITMTLSETLHDIVQPSSSWSDIHKALKLRSSTKPCLLYTSPSPRDQA